MQNLSFWLKIQVIREFATRWNYRMQINKIRINLASHLINAKVYRDMGLSQDFG